MSQTTTQTTTEGTAEASGTQGATTEGTEVEGGHSKFPPLDSHSFPSQLFWLVIFFALLYALMSKLVLPRIASILDARRNKIEGDLARAQALKEETEAALASYQKALADARSKASDIARETRDSVNADIASQQAALDAALAKKASEAEAKIAKSKATAMAAVDGIAAETAKEIIAALTGGKAAATAITKAIAAAKR